MTRNTGDSINSLDDLDERWKQQIEYHFAHYKDLKKPGTTDVQGWGDVEAAKRSLLNLSNDTKNKHEHE